MLHLWVGAAVLAMLVLGGTLWLRRRGSDTAESARAHDRARNRSPPVEIGGTYELGVTEITTHHSGTRQAVGKVEGFVIFIEEIPDAVSEGDAIRAKVMSFNKGETSATATFIDWS